jgi:HD-GYP domain-containing protein (c-di-GMP phosphodiesterase class II)
MRAFFSWVIVGAFLAAFGSIALVTTLQGHARADRDTQVALGQIELAFDRLQSAPYDGIGSGSAGWRRLERRMSAGRMRLERDLTTLRRESASRHLIGVNAPFRANMATIERIRTLLERGRVQEADSLGQEAKQSQRATERELEAAAADYRARALRSLDAARFGSAAAILTLVSLFAVFFLRSRRAHAEKERLVQENAQVQLVDAQLQVIERLARAAEYRDDDTGEHIRRVGDLASRIGAALGLPEEEQALLLDAAPLHDVGKIAIPDAILLKPGRLTPDEFDHMKRHARFGAEMLAGREFPLLAMAEEIALTHHERWDGSGYPAGLAGVAIPLMGRIVAVADVFDALTHARPYKDPWPIEAAVAEIERQSGRQFDPAVVQAFLQVLPDVPAERPLQPAAARGEQHSLRPIGDVELAIGVVQVGAHGAHLEPEVRGDLLVHLALGEFLDHLGLPR